MRVPRISHCSCSCNCFWWHVWEVENPQTSVSVLGQMHCKIWANWIGAKRNPIPCIPRYNLLSWCYYLFWKAKVVPKGGKKQSTLFCFYLQAFVVLHSFAQAKSNHMPGQSLYKVAVNIGLSVSGSTKNCLTQPHQVWWRRGWGGKGASTAVPWSTMHFLWSMCVSHVRTIFIKSYYCVWLN